MSTASTYGSISITISIKEDKMARSYKARNKRIIPRSGSGRFRATTAADFGIGGVCEVCNHFLIRHFDGDPDDPMPDPRLFRYRCFTCEPRTGEEEERHQAAVEAEQSKNKAFWDEIASIVEDPQ